MLNRLKTDLKLGAEIQAYLVELGIDNPCISGTPVSSTTIEKSFQAIFKGLNLDLSDDSLQGSPRRIANMYEEELFWGLLPKNFPAIMCVTNENIHYSEMLIERNIRVLSMCEHHFMPIVGIAHVAYIPNRKVLGLSKINRIVEYFSRRPQIQERLCEQIYAALSYILDTEDVAVQIVAEHMCVKMRGVEDSNCDTVTNKLGGKFFNGVQRSEFLQSVKI